MSCFISKTFPVAMIWRGENIICNNFFKVKSSPPLPGVSWGRHSSPWWSCHSSSVSQLFCQDLLELLGQYSIWSGLEEPNSVQCWPGGTSMFWTSTSSSSASPVGSLRAGTGAGLHSQPSPPYAHTWQWRPLCDLCATAVRSLCDLCAISVQPLCNLCAISVRPLCDLCAISVRPLCNLCAISVRPLCDLFQLVW